jgi:ELP3 family radical SAM enzyme/protein acetyltransferase
MKSIDDIEELMKWKPSNTISDESYPIYETIMYDLCSWVEDNKQTPFHILKNKGFTAFQHKLQRQHKIHISKPILNLIYKKMVSQNKIQENALLAKIIMKKQANDISGINQITLLTSPRPHGQDFSCKHDCYYCPNEPAHEDNNWTPQPRSYLAREPAVARANRNHFDPIKQTTDRLNSLLICGHKCDKLEFILEGGTMTEYPKRYLEEFFQQFIYASNTYFDNEKRPMKSLQEEIHENKYAKCRIIGICIETRPDAILENDEDNIPWVETLLSWGVTRIQLGVQHLNNDILKKINRGHSISKVIKALEILKNNCFKLDIHMMPDLPGSSPEMDKNMFHTLYTSPDFQPDQVKVYPCAIVPWTKIKEWYEEGTYVPYGSNKKLMEEVMEYILVNCPPWIRMPRIIRDIPEHYIEGGLKCSNMRQVATQKLEEHALKTQEIRSREIGRHPQYTIEDARYFVRSYEASNGTDYFLSFETDNNEALYGFLRLRIPNKKTSEEHNKQVIFSNTLHQDCALIRELHIYGGVERVDTKGNRESIQHSGLGTKLLKYAEAIAINNNMMSIAIISGIGVRSYYERRGYILENNYMVKTFPFVIFRNNLHNFAKMTQTLLEDELIMMYVYMLLISTCVLFMSLQT